MPATKRKGVNSSRKAMAFLHVIAEDPTHSLAYIQRIRGIHPAEGARLRKMLKKEGYIETRKGPGKGRKPATFANITPQGESNLGTLLPEEVEDLLGFTRTPRTPTPKKREVPARKVTPSPPTPNTETLPPPRPPPPDFSRVGILVGGKTDCPHHFDIPAANGPTSQGTCRRCEGAMLFLNSIPERQFI